MERIALILLLVATLYACSKNQPGNGVSYLNVKVVGEENHIAWQHFTSSVDLNIGSLKMEGTDYQFRLCSLDLRDVHLHDSLNIAGLGQLYYEDGVQFIPDTVSGKISITERNAKHIKGTIDAHFTDRTRNEQVQIKGEFFSLRSE